MNTSATDSNPYEVFEAIIDENSISGIIFAITDVINNILVVLITIIIGTKCWILKFTRTALHAYFCTLGVSRIYNFKVTFSTKKKNEI